MDGAEKLIKGSNEVASDRVEDNFAAKSSRLSLARLAIDVLPEKIRANCRVTHLKVLNLKHNRLELLPSELFLCVTQLEELDVSENCLSYLPEAIGGATKLRELRLRGNDLRNLPGGLCHLHALEILDLARNSLERLPTTVAECLNLRWLDLAQNCLEEIPREAGLLVKLEHIHLSGNPVRQMPLFIERLHTKGELLRSKSRRQKLVGRALQVRGSVRAAFVSKCLHDSH